MPMDLSEELQFIDRLFEAGCALPRIGVRGDDDCAQAIWRARRLATQHREPEALGLLAWLLLREAQRDEPDRSRWDRVSIDEGLALVDQALDAREVGAYTLQAAIAAVHVQAADAATTERVRLAGLHELLAQANPPALSEPCS